MSKTDFRTRLPGAPDYPTRDPAPDAVIPPPPRPLGGMPMPPRDPVPPKQERPVVDSEDPEDDRQGKPGRP